MIDTDSAFLTVLGKRLEGAGWKHRVLPGSVPVDDLVAMKVNALLIDISTMGPQGWEFLEKVCGSIPGLGVLVCTSQSTVRNGSEACGSGRTTGSPSPVTRKR